MGSIILIIILYSIPLLVCIFFRLYEKKRNVNKNTLIVFKIVVAIITILCFFSLSNIYGQSIIQKDDLWIIMALPCFSYLTKQFNKNIES